MMAFNNWLALFARCLRLVIVATFMLNLCLGCKAMTETAYSIEEQYNLYGTRSAEMSSQLDFSFKLTPDQVPFGQDIFFVATFTNMTDHLVVLRKPRQYGVIEGLYPDTILLFSVESLNGDTSFRYPLDLHPPPLSGMTIIERSEFVTLPPHGSQEIQLKLPYLVDRDDQTPSLELSPLPPGQYLVQMTYWNRAIGYQVKRNEEIRYVDVGAWVGAVESDAATLTITP